MYKLLLVDDEEFVLSGMSRLLHSLMQTKNLPIEEIRTAQNGLEAIELMDQSPADVILTDIKMPGMDGMELIERLSARNQNCKIIILSGFDSFEYAQTAIKNNIKAYLLKPVKRTDLELALEKVFGEISEETGHAEYVRKLEEQLSADLPILREKFFFELANGNYQKDLAEFLRLSVMHGPHQIALIAPDSFKTNDYSQVALEKDKQLILLQMSNELIQRIRPLIRCEAFQLHHRICVLLFPEDSQNNIYLEHHLKAYQTHLQQERNITCSIGISQPFVNIEDFAFYLEEAYAALKQRILIGHQALIFYSDVFPWQNQRKDSVLYEKSSRFKVDIYHALQAGQQDQVHSLLDAYKEELQRLPYCPLELIRTLSSDLITTFMMFSFEQSIDSKVLLYSNHSPAEVILLSNSLDDIFGILHQTATRIFESLSAKSQAETISTIRRIKSYVHAHVSEDISLESLSEVVYLTPNYISTLFKRETGVSFKDYVLQVKIQKAKDLLQSNKLKIHEIAQDVGYHSATYFSKVFRRETGLYPSEYRQEIGLKDIDFDTDFD